MSAARTEAALQAATKGLRPAFGKKRVLYVPGQHVVVLVDGLEYPVFIVPNRQGKRLLYRINVTLTDGVDWDTPSALTRVLNFNSEIFWGRAQVSGGGLQLEANLFAKTTTPKQLATVVRCVVLSAHRLVAELRVLGALTLPEGD